MSVLKKERKTSSAQFLENALQIQIKTLRASTKFPKRYTYLLTSHLTDAAAHGHGQVKKGNSIFPLNQQEAQLRRECFLKAYAEYQNLLSQLFVAKEMFEISDGTMLELVGLIDDELKLLKAVMKSDRERYKDLK